MLEWGTEFPYLEQNFRPMRRIGPSQLVLPVTFVGLFLLVVGFIVIGAGCKGGNVASHLPRTLYQTDNLIITQVSPDVYEHVSYLRTHDFGLVDCNGILIDNQGEVAIFDTPTNDAASWELLNWIRRHLKSRAVAIVPTHFHADCLGGLTPFQQSGVTYSAYRATVAKIKELEGPVPEREFGGHYIMPIGNTYCVLKFPGAGHTPDNIVVYYPEDHVLFGGCLVKSLGAEKGYLGDADTLAWAKSVERVKTDFPKAIWVIPGHGNLGSQALLDYTISLFINK